MADFTLIAKRTLDEDEYRVFRCYYLLGAGYQLCCRQLKMEHGEFFHYIYRVQRKLGKAFAETRPYPLYPVSDYFAGVVQKGCEVSEPKAPAKKKWIYALPLSA